MDREVISSSGDTGLPSSSGSDQILVLESSQQPVSVLDLVSSNG